MEDVNWLGKGIVLLEQAVGSLGTVAVLYGIFLVVYVGSKRVMRREAVKRKDLLVKLADCKNAYLTGDKAMNRSKLVNGLNDRFKRAEPILRMLGFRDKGEVLRKICVQLATQNDYLVSLHAQEELGKNEAEALRNECKALQREAGVKPWLLVGSFIAPILVMVAVFSQLMSMTEIPSYLFLPILTAILTFIPYAARKRRWIFAGVSCLLFLLYKELNGAMNLFLMAYFLMRIVEKQIAAYQAKQQKTGAEGE